LLFAEAGRILKPKGFFGIDVTTFGNNENKILVEEGSLYAPNLFRHSEDNIHQLLKQYSFEIISSEKQETWKCDNYHVTYDHNLLLLQKN
jgi:predicted TPR repeat methyltransferase